METRLIPIFSLEVGDQVIFAGKKAEIGYITKHGDNTTEVELDFEEGTAPIFFDPEELIHQVI